jgi:hypothetical protein
MTATDHIAVPLVLAIAEPGGTWHVEHITLWFTPPPPTDHAMLEQEAIATWVGTHPRTDAVHLWLMDDDGWEEDPSIAEDRRRRGATSEDDLPL